MPKTKILMQKILIRCVINNTAENILMLIRFYAYIFIKNLIQPLTLLIIIFFSLICKDISHCYF